jgi:nucleoside-diphosphate-sugar epimerase
MPDHATPRHLLIDFEQPFAVELCRALQSRDGADQVEGTNDMETLPKYIERWRPTDVYLLSSVFPPTGAEHPAFHWHRNTRDLLKVLYLARRNPFKLFYPSSIQVFGPSAPAHDCPQDAPQDPPGYFGLSKRAGEHWCEHHFLQYETDTRSLRFPVIVQPSKGKYAATPAASQARPVIHLQDAVRATIELMGAPKAAIRERRSYNLAGTSLSLSELVEELEHQKGYAGIDVWNLPAHPGPASMNDGAARADWGWKPKYDLVQLVRSFWAAR